MARANRNRESRRFEKAQATCRANGHDWGKRHNHYNDPFDGSPYLPGGLVGWSQTCKRCGLFTGRGEY